MTEKMPAAEHNPMKQEWLQIIRGINTLLQGHEDKSDQEKIQLVADHIAQTETEDFPRFVDEMQLEDLLKSLKEYHGDTNYQEFIANKLQESMAKYGRYDNGMEYQEKLIKRYCKRRGFEQFEDNSIFSYGLDPKGRAAHIHLFNPYRQGEHTQEAGDYLKLVIKFGEGLKRLVQDILPEHPEITRITAASPLLHSKAYQMFLQRIGFESIGFDGYRHHDQEKPSRDPKFEATINELQEKIQKIQSFRHEFMQAVREARRS